MNDAQVALGPLTAALSAVSALGLSNDLVESAHAKVKRLEAIASGAASKPNDDEAGQTLRAGPKPSGKPSAKDKSICLRGICTGHSSYITHLDFSRDSRWIQSTCGAYELLFWDVRSPNPGRAYTSKKPKRIRQQTSASAMRDIEWSTWTCTLGWPVQGIWPKCADGTDINSVHLSNDLSKDDSSVKKISRTLITADDSGMLKMFRYPCIEKGAPFAVESGHSSHVTNVRWSCDNEWVVSTGGNDRCVFQWKKLGEEEDEGGVAHSVADEDQHDDLGMFDPAAMAAMGGGDEHQAVKPWVGQIAAPSQPPASTPLVPEVGVELEWIFGYRSQDCRDNVRFSASGDIIYHAAAVGIALTDESTPEDEGDDSLRKNNPYKQRFFMEHDDDILCLATDRSGRYVITGQIQSSKSKRTKPCAKIWDSESCRLICTLGGVHQNCVSSVCFSKDAKYVATVGGDPYHSVALWNTRSGQWNDGKLVTKTRGDPGNTLFLAFAAGEGINDFATGGKGHIRFWKISGHTMKSKKGILGNIAVKSKRANPFITAISICPNEAMRTSSCFLVGMYTGHIYVFIENKLEHVLEAHGKGGCGALHAQCSLEDHSTGNGPAYFVSGGADGEVILWACGGSTKNPTSWNFVKLEKFNLQSSVSPRPKCHSIRSVCWDAAQGASKSGGLILVGTKGSEIYKLPVTKDHKIRKGDNGVKEVLSGHWADEVWGLAAHPNNSDILATSGDDRTVRIWKVAEDDHQPIAVGDLKTMGRAVAWHSSGSWLVVGLGGRLGRRNITSRRKKKRGKDFDGSFMIFDTSKINSEIQRSAAGDYLDLKTRRTTRTTHLPHPSKGNDNLWISDVKFTPDDSYVAFATHAQRVFIYDSRPLRTGDGKKELECMWQCNKSSSAVTHIDWSLRKDGGFYLQTNDLSYEILRYHVPSPESKSDESKSDSNGKKKIPKPCKQVKDRSTVRKVNWHTYTVPIGWGVQGIWPAGADGSDINAVDRSRSKSLVATADDFGDVKIFNYPCTTAGASCKVNMGHSSHVMNVRFNMDESALFSVGGNDRSVFKWKITKES
jgi:microtubule-associated protein-like 6